MPVYQHNTDDFPETSSRYIVEVTPDKYGESAGLEEDEKNGGHTVEIMNIDGNFTPDRRLTESHAEESTGAS